MKLRTSLATALGVGLLASSATAVATRTDDSVGHVQHRHGLVRGVRGRRHRDTGHAAWVPLRSRTTSTPTSSSKNELLCEDMHPRRRHRSV